MLSTTKTVIDWNADAALKEQTKRFRVQSSFHKERSVESKEQLETKSYRRRHGVRERELSYPKKRE